MSGSVSRTLVNNIGFESNGAGSARARNGMVGRFRRGEDRLEAYPTEAATRGMRCLRGTGGCRGIGTR